MRDKEQKVKYIDGKWCDTVNECYLNNGWYVAMIVPATTKTQTGAYVVLEREKVPEILLSGNHGKIDEYRYEERLYTTLIKRPDLFKRYINENKLDINKVNEIITKKEGN